MIKDRHVFCGKCGKQNPAENQFCRGCGHRLADDIVETEIEEDLLPSHTNPVPEVELQRYPLIDPRTGEPLSIEKSARPTSAPPPPASRVSTILGSLGIHLVALLAAIAVTLAVLAPSDSLPTGEEMMSLSVGAEDITRRMDAREIDDEQAAAELIALFDRYGMTRLQALLSGPILLAFFMSGLIGGRIFRPIKLLDIALSGVLFGGICALFLMSPLVFPFAFGFSVLGAMLGRRRR